MDVENMHPFCLPFSLCHDATSSIMATDDSSSDCNANNNKQLEHNSKLDRQLTRSKSSSPSDDEIQIFHRISSTNHHSSSLSSHSLLDDESIIGTTNIHSEDHFFTSIDELTRQTDLIDNDDDCGFHDEDQNSTEFCRHSTFEHNHSRDHDHEDVWNTSNYLLFSPNHNKPSQHGGKSFSKHHQVFQHVNDPSDIKSSPTLAQLNLNSSDDPNDGLWDTSATPAPTTAMNLSSCTSNAPAATSSDLSIGTSIFKGFTSNCTQINPITCNHSHHHHHHQHHYLNQHNQNNHRNNNSFTNEFSHFTAQQLPLCHHHLHQHFSARSPASQATQATCLAVTPFVRATNEQQQHSMFCPNHSHAQTRSATPGNDSKAHHPNVPPLNHLDCRTRHQISVTPGDGAQVHYERDSRHPNSSVLTPNQNQRCASPALVTSSSSPLSSTSVAAAQANQTNCNNQHPTTTDNKLKENIEYLTALLCNGSNKLDGSTIGNINNNNNNNSQSSTISSTMIKSYTTLTQTLSTGPRLLERQQVVANNLGLTNQLSPAAVDMGSSKQPNGTVNSHQAMPQVFRQQHSAHTEGPPNHRQQQQQQLQFGASANLQADHQGAPRPCLDQQQHQHWFKPAVESSVSVADSTAENQATSSRLLEDAKNKNISALAGGACAHYYAHNQSNIQFAQEGQSLVATKPSELRVLSSLLSTNKNDCSAPTDCNHLATPAVGACMHDNTMGSSYAAYASNPTPAQLPQIQTQKSIESKDGLQEAGVSIPPNGRPITLTPIANNGIIVQQQPRNPTKNQTTKPLFAQPASPSTSSTTSSIGPMEINSSSSSSSSSSSNLSLPASNTTTSAPNKRQKTSQQQGDSKSDQSGRTNSMSTDCSLSSHDEGFSSQVDNDDCNSTRDSDDDDDEVDSDDESFYGDYTNSDLIGASISDDAECKWTLNMGRTRRNGQKRFFWQYNVQSKGPKGARMCPTDGNDDNPFVLPEASDPVFSSDCQIEGVKHSGKARRGDGNDLTPNPRKLLMIGLELKKLGRIINDLIPVTDLPLNARNKTRKEKNKLASRACRLKKKAQHEANKIKLYGLQREHQQVVLAIYDIRKYLLQKVSTNQQQANFKEAEQQQLAQLRSSALDPRVAAMAENCSMKVAGQTSDYVNSVLEKVVSGCIDGGLQT